MSPKAVDDLIFWTAIILPTWIVLRSGRRGVVYATLLQWGLLIVAGIVLAAMDPNRGFNLDALWVLTGWIFCFLFCLAIFSIKRAAIWVWTRTHGV